MLSIRELSSEQVNDPFSYINKVQLPDGSNLPLRLRVISCWKETCFTRKQIQSVSGCFLFVCYVLFVGILLSHHTDIFFSFPKKLPAKYFFLEYSYSCRKEIIIISKNCLLSSIKPFPLYSSLHKFDLLHCRRVSLGWILFRKFTLSTALIETSSFDDKYFQTLILQIQKRLS